MHTYVHNILLNNITRTCEASKSKVHVIISMNMENKVNSLILDYEIILTLRISNFLSNHQF